MVQNTQYNSAYSSKFTKDQSQSLDSLKVGMLYRHDTRICKQLLRIVVDELTVDEAVDVVLEDHVHFLFHLLLQMEGER